MGWYMLTKQCFDIHIQDPILIENCVCLPSNAVVCDRFDVHYQNMKWRRRQTLEKREEHNTSKNEKMLKRNIRLTCPFWNSFDEHLFSTSVLTWTVGTTGLILEIKHGDERKPLPEICLVRGFLTAWSKYISCSQYPIQCRHLHLLVALLSKLEESTAPRRSLFLGLHW